jgi:hypothetical protein
LSVNHLVARPQYFLTRLNLALAVDLVRRDAEECNEGEIRQPRLILSVFCPYTRNNKPQELPHKAALGAWFCWALKARLGSSHD